MCMFTDVLAFHRKFGVTCVERPTIPSEKLKLLRQSLIAEEYVEVMTAMDREDIVEIADGFADLIYVILGSAISYGIDLRPVWDEVHRSNMQKEGGSRRADGKILKPEGWQRPDIAKVLATSCIEIPED